MAAATPLVVGLLSIAAGVGLLSRPAPSSAYATHVPPSMLLLGIGGSVVMVTASNLATIGAGPHSGVAGAAVGATQQVGAALGTALLSSTAAGTTSERFGPERGDTSDPVWLDAAAVWAVTARRSRAVVPNGARREPRPPERCRTGMRKLLLALAGAAAVLFGVAASPAPAGAGGWAIVSFDALPPLTAGEQATITFRVLQHGVTPVEMAAWPGTQLRLRVTGPSGTVEVPATATGVGGRFTASFTVPRSSEAGLRVVWDAGLVVEESAIDVPIRADASTAWPDWTPAAFAAIAITGTALVSSDVLSRRRARATADGTARDLLSA